MFNGNTLIVQLEYVSRYVSWTIYTHDRHNKAGLDLARLDARLPGARRMVSEAGGNREGRWRGFLGWQNEQLEIWHAWTPAYRGRGGLSPQRGEHRRAPKYGDRKTLGRLWEATGKLAG